MRSAAFIAVDWGTTNFRAYLLDADGNILDRRNSSHGVRHLNKQAFPEFLHDQTVEWRNTPLPILICGMAGSTLGWHEVPYIECPLDFITLAQHCYAVDKHLNAWIVPGLRCISDAGQPDMMRGEETQLLGWYNTHPDTHEQLLILPGTHSKWAMLKAGQLSNFATAMTGELYALLKEHSILTCNGNGPLDTEAYREGLKWSKRSSLLHLLFSVRSRSLIGELKDEQKTAYLAGLLVGSEIQQMLNVFGTTTITTPITIIGSPALIESYGIALHYFGYKSQSMSGEHASTRGLLHIYQTRFQ